MAAVTGASRPWWPWALAAVVAAVVISLATAKVASHPRPPATIGDKAFIAQADALCERELKDLRAPRERSEDPLGQEAKDDDRPALAARVEEVADGIDKVADQLGTLTVRQADQFEVATWLEEWANYTGIGRQYAAAVRTKPAKTYSAIAATGTPVVKRIARFARANHIDNCVL